MRNLASIKSLEQIKVLADPRRLLILKLLMDKPATLSQLGRLLGEHPAWIRHHLKKLEGAGLVELVERRITGGFVEKYYRSVANAYLFQELLLPKEQEDSTLVFMGSHDLALEMLAQQFNQLSSRAHLLVLPVGSLDGLIALRQGLAQLTGCHLLDFTSGEYNQPYVRHFFPDRRVLVINLAYREQGLMIAPGNPRQITGLEDLARPDITFTNRNRGSGTRLWLDRQIKLLNLSEEKINGYTQESNSHTQVALAVQLGKADIGLGIRAAANRAGLLFIPLFQERYDLIVPQEQHDNPALTPFFDFLQSSRFHRTLNSLEGYDAIQTGETFAT